jgi:hypothetical protein
MMEDKLRLQQQFEQEEVPWSPDTDPVIQRQIHLDKLQGDYKPQNDPVLQRQLYLESRQKTGGEISKSEEKALSSGAATMEIDEATGEYKVVPKSKAVDPTVKSYVNMFKNGSIKNISNVPAEVRGQVVAALDQEGVDPLAEGKAREAKGAISLIKNLKGMYEGGEGKSDDLSKGRLLGGLNSIRSTLGMFDEGTTYKDLKKGFTASLKSLTGDAGVLTDQDALRLQNLLPNLNSTPGEAERKWREIDKILSDKYGIGLGLNVSDVGSNKPDMSTQNATGSRFKIRVK